MPLSDPIIEVLSVFRPLFTTPTWRKLMTLLTGTRFSQGPRTVAAALRASGNAQASNWSSFHQVLNRARWCPVAVSSPGLRWIVMAVVVTLPWTKQRWALPFLCVLATTPEVSERLGKRHKTVGMCASDDQSGSPMAS